MGTQKSILDPAFESALKRLTSLVNSRAVTPKEAHLIGVILICASKLEALMHQNENFKLVGRGTLHTLPARQVNCFALLCAAQVHAMYVRTKNGAEIVISALDVPPAQLVADLSKALGGPENQGEVQSTMLHYLDQIEDDLDPVDAWLLLLRAAHVTLNGNDECLPKLTPRDPRIYIPVSIELHELVKHCLEAFDRLIVNREMANASTPRTGCAGSLVFLLMLGAAVFVLV